MLAGGAAVLAVEPVLWLVQSWVDPAYGSYGWALFLAGAGAVAWSVTSPLGNDRGSPRLPIYLLLSTAVLRTVGHVLDISTVSALALAVDVYALAKLAGLDRRTRAVSPVALAALFLTTLPVERLVERFLGHTLQTLSADTACAALSMIFSDIACAGARITVNGTPVMVDLPCAGIGGLTLLGAGLALAAVFTRPRVDRAVLACALAAVTAVIGNAVRVSVLTAGAGTGVDLLAEPYHSAIGLATLALMAMPPLWVLTAGHAAAPPATAPGAARPAGRALPWPLALGFAIAALGILALPVTPLDRTGTALAVALPASLAGHIREPMPLAPREAAYYRTYGGGAAKAVYGPMGLLVTRTTAPLRHLHEPADCLRGLGFSVNFLGTTDRASALYAATDGDGRTWRVEVTYISDTGLVVPTVSAAIWHWLRAPASEWRMVQRLTPASLPAPARTTLDRAVLAALDVPMT